MHFARLMHDEQGSKIIAVSDSKGGIVSEKGFDPKEVQVFKEKTGSVVGFPGTKPVSNEEILELDVDILAPCALEGVLTSENAPRVKAKIIGEGANGPTTPEADDIFHKRGIVLIPDILANGGGVTVSYFEWVQNLSEFFWTKSDVDQKLEGVMVGAFNRVWDMREAKKVDTRQAAYMVAINGVVEAYKWRGIFPSESTSGAAARPARTGSDEGRHPTAAGVRLPSRSSGRARRPPCMDRVPSSRRGAGPSPRNPSAPFRPPARKGSRTGGGRVSLGT